LPLCASYLFLALSFTSVGISRPFRLKLKEVMAVLIFFPTSKKITELSEFQANGLEIPTEVKENTRNKYEAYKGKRFVLIYFFIKVHQNEKVHVVTVFTPLILSLGYLCQHGLGVIGSWVIVLNRTVKWQLVIQY